MSERRSVKTEHSGAKNRGGFWGTRAEAKKTSRRVRRERGKDEIRRERPTPSSAAADAKGDGK